MRVACPLAQPALHPLPRSPRPARAACSMPLRHPKLSTTTPCVLARVSCRHAKGHGRFLIQKRCPFSSSSDRVLASGHCRGFPAGWQTDAQGATALCRHSEMRKGTI